MMVGGGDIRVVLPCEDPSTETSVIARVPPQMDRWQHVSATYDGAKLLLYVDGQLSNGSDAHSGPVKYPDTARLLIGGDGTGSSNFIGHIDDVRLWNCARNGEEVKSAMRSRLRGDEACLVGYWRFDRSDGECVPDQTAIGDASRNAVSA